MKAHRILIVLLAAALSAPAMLIAQQAEIQGEGSPDAGFMKKAAQANLAEIQEGEMALRQSQDPAVRHFAHRLIQDHERANSQLARIADKRGIELPNHPSEDQRDELGKLESDSGSGLASAFSREEVKDHEKAISEYEKEAREGKDPEVRAYAEDTIPILREHEQMAADLRGR